MFYVSQGQPFLAHSNYIKTSGRNFKRYKSAMLCLYKVLTYDPSVTIVLE